MNAALEQMLAEKADKATMPVDPAIVRRTLGNENLSDDARGGATLSTGRFIRVAMLEAEGYRVNEADQKDTNKSARQWRVKTTLM